MALLLRTVRQVLFSTCGAATAEWLDRLGAGEAGLDERVLAKLDAASPGMYDNTDTLLVIRPVRSPLIAPTWVDSLSPYNGLRHDGRQVRLQVVALSVERRRHTPDFRRQRLPRSAADRHPRLRSGPCAHRPERARRERAESHRSDCKSIGGGEGPETGSTFKQVAELLYYAPDTATRNYLKGL